MNRSYHDLVAEARTRIAEVSAAEVMDMQRAGTPFLLLDVREDNEVNLGIIPGAIHVSRGNLEKLIDGVAPRDARLILYCASGSRSALAADTLGQMGYQSVSSLAGGIRGWADAGGDID